MPTIIALDMSLSMTKIVPAVASGSNEDSVTYHQLAVQAIHEFLNYLTEHSKLEYVALMVYSSSYEIPVNFTRDYDTVRQALYNIEHCDKVGIEGMLQATGSLLLSNWGTQNYNQVLVFTRCGIGLGTTSLQSTIFNLKKCAALKSASSSFKASTPVPPQFLLNDTSNTSWIPFSNLSKLSFICFGSMTDSYFQNAVELYQQFLDISGQSGELFVAHSKTNKITYNSDSAQPTTITQWKGDLIPKLIENMCETNYKPFAAILKCGNYQRLESSILIWPTPMPFSVDEQNDASKMISRKLKVCGFINLADIGSPMSISRHLILPNGMSKSAASNGISDVEKLDNDIKQFYSKDDDEVAEQAKLNEVESACILLHGALKFENLAAVVLLNDDWFGFIHSYSDIKRKSNLILTILPPGNDNIPWLGDFRYFATADEALAGESSQFPLKPEKRSYSQNCVVWIKQAGLQSDIQKLLRHAKKLPDKTQQFYKELNRIRRAALSLGFVELLESLSTLFEREVLLLPNNVSPDCGIQLKYSAIELRKLSNRELKITISPIPTKYNGLV